MENKVSVKITNAEVALRKAQHYCAYQERCQQEMRNKLYEWGLWKDAVESIISKLILDGFIDEERFAKAYAGGKFRVKKWGRIKIKMELKKRMLSDYSIRSAMKEIDDRDYRTLVEKIISEKAKTVTSGNLLQKKQIIARYIISRGFEPELVWEMIEGFM